MAGTSNSSNLQSTNRNRGYGSDCHNETSHIIIKTLERLSLDDDGQRNWDKESIDYLNEHYEDWKDPKTTVMVPPCLQLDPESSKDGEKTEQQIFDLLKGFGEKYKEPMFVVHSYDFSELIHKLEKGQEKEWIQGEHDFVIIHREHGVIFLEVKSKKSTKGAYKEGKRQIEKAREATLSYLRKRFGKSKAVNASSYRWPGFVVMPNCKKQEQNTVQDDVVYKEDCISHESLKRWWEDKIAGPGSPKKIDQALYEELVRRFVPLSCLSPTLNLQIDSTHENIVKIFTPKQLESWYCSSPVQWFTGPAGSGKTVLLIEKAKEIANKIEEREKNERILVLCFNTPLSIHLENEINVWFRHKYDAESPVTIKTYDAFIKDVGGFGIVNKDDQEEFDKRRKEVVAGYTPQTEDQKYEHIFVDEGQDLPGDQWPKFLERLHNKPDYRSRYYFWVMFDSNQHVQLTEPKNLPWDYLANASQLKYVFRNTKKIFSLFKKYHEDISGEGEIKLGHNENGLDIVWDQGLKKKDHRSNIAELVAKHIRKLRDQKVQEKNITVLARASKAAISLVQELDSQYEIRGVKAEEHLRGKDRVTVDSIRRFKGLESKVVILCDPECYPSDKDVMEKTRQLLYTAVSRCFCYLIIVSTPDGCKRIKNVRTHIAYSGSSSRQEKRQCATSLEEDFASLENEHQQAERHSAFNPYGKRSRDTKYQSGPPERRVFVDKADRESSDDETISSAVKFSPMEEKMIERSYEKKKKSQQSRPINVDGSDLLEPGDESIKDQIRTNAFSLLQSVVEKNLTFTENDFTDEEVKQLIVAIEHKTYQKYRTKQDPSPYTRAMRALKKDIVRDNREQKLNSEVQEALSKTAKELSRRSQLL